MTPNELLSRAQAILDTNPGPLGSFIADLYRELALLKRGLLRRFLEDNPHISPTEQALEEASINDRDIA